MKRKIGFAAAVILLGVFVAACSQKPAEPAPTPAPSPTPAATAEPATTPEPTPSPQPVDQDVVDHGESTEGQEATNETDEAYDAIMDAHDEQFVQECMEQFGLTREEAEAALKEANARGDARREAREEANRKSQEEYFEQKRIESEQAIAEQDAYMREHFGISYEEWMTLSYEEILQRQLEFQNGGK